MYFSRRILSIVRNVIPALWLRPFCRIASGIYTPCIPLTSPSHASSASRLLSISYYSRMNSVVLPKDTPNIPQGYPKDTCPNLQKMHLYYIYTMYIYTFCWFLSKNSLSFCPFQSRSMQA